MKKFVLILALVLVGVGFTSACSGPQTAADPSAAPEAAPAEEAAPTEEIAPAGEAAPAEEVDPAADTEPAAETGDEESLVVDTAAEDECEGEVAEGECYPSHAAACEAIGCELEDCVSLESDPPQAACEDGDDDEETGDGEGGDYEDDSVAP